MTISSADILKLMEGIEERAKAIEESTSFLKHLIEELYKQNYKLVLELKECKGDE